MTDFELMGAALDEARKAAALGEVPVGAVVARNGQIVAAAHNTRETEKNALHHAELLAIDAACKALGGWRLLPEQLLKKESLQEAVLHISTLPKRLQNLRQILREMRRLVQTSS